MDKDNSQEPMITSNSPSLEKGREKVYYSSNPAFYVGIDCIISVSTKGKSACYC